MDNASFSGVIVKETAKGGWTYVVWPESAEFLGTRKAVKISVNIGGNDFSVTCLPSGDGKHFIPLNKSVMGKIGKVAGDTIRIEVRKIQ